MVDPETAARLRAIVNPGNIEAWKTMGIEFLDAEPGRARLRIAMTPALGTRRPEVMHGGVTGVLIDSAAGAAVMTLSDGDDRWQGISTTDMNISYLEAITDEVTAVAEVLRPRPGQRGRIAYTEVRVLDASERLMAIGRVTIAIIRRRE